MFSTLLPVCLRKGCPSRLAGLKNLVLPALIGVFVYSKSTFTTTFVEPNMNGFWVSGAACLACSQVTVVEKLSDTAAWSKRAL